MNQDKKIYIITAVFFVIAVFLHGAGYFTNYLYFFGWLTWIPALVLAVLAIMRIVRDKYIKNPYIQTKKVLLTNEFIIFAVVTVYVCFNVVYNCYILRNGGGEYTDGVYYLINLGERVREISAEEYSRLLLAEYRMFTGHILFLYSLLLLFFRMKRMEYEK